MNRLASMLRRLLTRTDRTEAGERGARAESARVVFAPAEGGVSWAGEDEEGLLVAGMRGLVRLRRGESTPRQLASTAWVRHHALGPRGLVWLEGSSPCTEVWWIEAGQESPRRLATSGGAPDGLVAYEGGVYWASSAPVMDPDNPKVMANANARVFHVGFDGGSPVELAHCTRHIHPCFADSEGVAWYDIDPATVRVFEATARGVSETTRFPSVTGKDELWGSATTLDASAVYLYDREAGGLVAMPRRGGEPRLLAHTREPALALVPRDAALYAIIGDARRAPREIWRVDLVTSEVDVLGRFAAERLPHGGEYWHHGLAVGRDDVYVHGGTRLLSVPRAS